MNKLLIKAAFFASAFFLLNTSYVSAQNGRANGGGPNNNDGNENGNGNNGQGDAGCGNCQGNNGNGRGNQGESVPIDGGASLLLASGAAYGLKKLKDTRKSNSVTKPVA